MRVTHSKAARRGRRLVRCSESLVASLVLLNQASPAFAQEVDTVRADNAPVWGAQPELVEELRIGDDPGEELGQVGGVVVTRDGTIWIADRITAMIHVYDASGNHLHAMGGEGEGPGEFGWLRDVALLPSEEIVAWDARRHRILVFGPDGYRGGFSTNLRGFTETSWDRTRLLADDEGRILLLARPRAGPPRWMKFSRNGRPLDSIAVPPRDPDGTSYGADQLYPFGHMAAYRPVTRSAMGSDGRLILGRTDEYAFLLHRRDGTAVRIERSWTPVSVQAAERRSFQNVENVIARNRGDQPGTVESVKPAWWAFWVDEESRLWVATHQVGFEGDASTPAVPPGLRHMIGTVPERPWWEPLVLDVIEPSGRFLGTIAFPNPLTRLVAARDRSLWVVEEDGATGVEHVVRYQIHQLG